MATHTPGPWEMLPTVTDGPEQGVSIVGANLGGLIGAALPWPTEIDSGDFSRVEANARLIAAAPLLLEALDDLLALYVRLVESGDAGFWDQEKKKEVIAARAAIAAARQESAS